MTTEISRPRIIRAIFRMPPEDGEFSIESVAGRAWYSVNGSLNLAEEEFISRYRRAIFSDLQNFDFRHRGIGGIPTFDYFEDRGLRLRWAISAPDDRHRRAKLVGRALTIDWISGISRSRDYEFLGAMLMRRLGARKVFVTSQGNEFGIDFVALVPAFSRSPLFLSGGAGVRVVGQSKLYASSVQREKIQAFNDVMSSIRNNKAELKSILPAWFRSHHAPLVGLFMANSGYQSGAKECAAQNGYVLLDEAGVSEVIACSSKFEQLRSPAAFHRLLWKELGDIELIAS